MTFALYPALYRPGDTVEIRAIVHKAGNAAAWDGWSSGIVYGYFDDPAAYAAALDALDESRRCEGIYTTLNPVDGALLARAVNRLVGGKRDAPTSKDEDITERRWLLVDIDPTRPAGISSTDAELQIAADHAARLREWLTGLGWPDPLRAASGNGVHLLYPVALPNDDASRDTLAHCLKSLAALFDSDKATIDTKVFNAARITKAYGTVTRKGDSTPARPHRRSGFAHVPSPLTPVPLRLLTELADRNRQAEAANTLARTQHAAPGGRWSPDRLIAEALAKAGPGNRNHAGFWLACQLRDQGYSEAEAGKAMQDYAARVPDPGSYRENEALSSLRQAYSEPARDPRGEWVEWGDDADHYDGYGECPDVDLLALLTAPAPHATESTLPYLEEDDAIFYVEKRTAKDGKPYQVNTLVAKFVARITREINTEDGDTIFQISGTARRGGGFALEVNASEFGDTRRLKAALEAAAGARDGLMAGQDKHIGPAIKHLTTSAVERITRYNRTGWAGGRFLLPGRDNGNIEIHLHPKLPYAVSPAADPDVAPVALSLLLDAVDAPTTLALAAALSAPLARVAGWRNERYAVFLSGRTGSFKTSWAQCLLMIYGPDFGRDELLLKWGEGATRNALMGIAIGAADVPLLVDNYKPQTGYGQRDFVNLIHNIMEGGEKDRMTRAATLRSPRSVHAWPIFTGEDVPDSDAASLARVLVVEFLPVEPGMNDRLTAVQSYAPHLPAVGLAWIEWLESVAGQRIVADYATGLTAARNRWASYLYGVSKDVQNPMRVATNLATNELCWNIACHHPLFGSVMEAYSNQHLLNLERVAAKMSMRTTASLEAEQFIGTVRALLSGGRYVIQSRAAEGSPFDKDRLIGWYDDDGVYLIPELSLAAVRATLGRDALNNISPTTLYSQLATLGLLADRNQGRHTRQIRAGGERVRVLHLTPGAVRPDEDEETEEEVVMVKGMGL